MSESMILRVEAAIAEAVIETGDKEFASKLGLFLADHPGLIASAGIAAMREPTWEMASAALGNREQHEKSGTADKTPQEYVDAWYAMINAALIWPAGSADRAGVPMARD